MTVEPNGTPVVLDELRASRRTAVTAAALVVAAFWVYKPLTYYEPLTNAELQRRAIVPLWDLTCATCPHGASQAEPCRPSN